MRLTISLCVFVATGCTAVLRGGTDEGSGAAGTAAGASPAATNSPSGVGGNADGFVDGTAPSGDPLAAGPMPMRRLSRTEYENTLRDLLGASSALTSSFPEDVTGSSGFHEPTSVSAVEVRRYRDSAESAVTDTVAVRLAELAPCTSADERSCASAFVQSFGARAFRRPLVAAETEELVALYDVVRAPPISGGYGEAVQAVATAMLQSPRFIYRWELGTAAPSMTGNIVNLTPYEIASRLSYFLWSSMPDGALFEAASTGALATAAEIEAQARRMLRDPRAKSAVQSFWGQMLRIDKLPQLSKDANAYPGFDSALAGSMRDEILKFSEYATLELGSWQNLLTSRDLFVNERLAALYGVPGIAGEALQLVPGPASRPGILTRAGFLAMNANTYETSPVLRGQAILKRFLCGSVPPPPPDVETMLPQPTAGQQTREKYEAHVTNPSCAGCHAAMDPLGFALEQYDGIGAYRTLDAGRAVNASGHVNLDGQDKPFTSMEELAPQLAASPQVGRCAAVQWLRFALGRPDVAADVYSLQLAYSQFQDRNSDIRELLVALVLTPTFTKRVPSPGEVLQ